MEIYTFDKSLQERLVEFTEILCSRGVTVPASQVRTEWTYYVELVIEPVGWKALWKIPRLLCQDFNIHYPTIVAVVIESINFEDLCALVKITAVQDEIHLPEKYEVSLIELYPTINQENIALDMMGTATCIDKLRFFFNYLWMPWDMDDDENIDWVTNHLEPRIRLYYDMNRNVISKETSDAIRNLIREGREIQEKITRLEDSICDDEETHAAMDEGTTCKLMKLHLRLQQIKTEMEVLENPVMREMLARTHQMPNSHDKSNMISNEDKQTGHFIWLGGSLEALKGNLDRLQTLSSKDLFFKISNSLEDALQTCNANDIVLLGEGQYQVENAGGLEEGGIIKGIFNFENTVLFPKETEGGRSVLDFSASMATLENFSLNLADFQAGIIIRKGCVKMKDCKIFTINASTIKLGLVVLPGAQLLVENSTFVNLGTAIAAYATGSVTLKNCSFKNCGEGVQLHDKATLIASECDFSDFKEYAIRIETSKYLTNSDSKTGSIELLKNIPEISLNDCKFEKNTKADVILRTAESTLSKNSNN